MQRVTVRVFGGATEEKILVNEEENVLIVTTEEEFKASERENRPPVAVGFRLEYLVKRY